MPYIRQGMTVLEPGPGMGFFTLELARLVGATGRVVAIDVQKEMIDRLRRRVERSGLTEHVELRLADTKGMHIEDLALKVNFIFAFAMAHEVPDKSRFFNELFAASALNCRLLISEPAWHVGEVDFGHTIDVAQGAGFSLESRPIIKSNRSALLTKYASRRQ